MSQYPGHGRQAAQLMRRALGQAASASSQQRAGFADFIEAGAAQVANDAPELTAR